MEQQKLTVPIAIIVAGALIAGAVIFSNNNGSGSVAQAPTDNQEEQQAPQPSGSTDAVNPVTAEDQIKGDINAPVKIVEYSDFECPFCKRFHNTMNQIMDEYGDGGQVAWIYRQFPLDQLHPKNARRASVASECVAELGGNDAFWKFTDGWFEVSPTNDQTDFEAVTARLISEIGLDKNAFNTCLASGKYDQHIQDDIDNATATGGRGTPWSIVIGPDGTTYSLNGAQPYEAVKQLIEIALNGN